MGIRYIIRLLTTNFGHKANHVPFNFGYIGKTLWYFSSGILVYSTNPVADPEFGDFIPPTENGFRLRLVLPRSSACSPRRHECSYWLKHSVANFQNEPSGGTTSYTAWPITIRMAVQVLLNPYTLFMVSFPLRQIISCFVYNWNNPHLQRLENFRSPSQGPPYFCCHCKTTLRGVPLCFNLLGETIRKVYFSSNNNFAKCENLLREQVLNPDLASVSANVGHECFASRADHKLRVVENSKSNSKKLGI